MSKMKTVVAFAIVAVVAVYATSPNLCTASAVKENNVEDEDCCCVRYCGRCCRVRHEPEPVYRFCGQGELPSICPILRLHGMRRRPRLRLPRSCLRNRQVR